MSTTGNTDQDLTRKGRREESRAQRKALEEAESSRANRRKRLIQLGGVVGVVAIIIAVILIATGGSPKKGIVKGAAANATVTEVSALLSGIPQSSALLGNPKAPVTLQYFGDLECPVCQSFTLGALPTLIEKYVRKGKMKIEYLSLETATREPSTFVDQQVAALAAGKQNLMWDYIELFYHEQGQEDSGYVTESYLQGIAQQVKGLNLAKWSSDRNSSALSTAVSNGEKAAVHAGFTGTPSFLLGKTGGQLDALPNMSLTEASGFEAAINKLLT